MTTGNFKHGEAYKLIKSVSELGRVEWLWNSRDGVTPFCIIDNLGCAAGLKGKSAIGGFAPSGKPLMQHADWHEDTFCPNFVPPVGMRIFVDGEPSQHGGFEPRVVIVDLDLHARFAELARLRPMRIIDGRIRRFDA
jgi:hypothetical protein